MIVDRMNQAFEAEVPVLPLASVVLFPGTVLPLQIVRAGLCDLIDDALRSDGTLAVVMLKPNAEDHGRNQDNASLPVFDVGCLCRIIHAEHRSNGRIEVLLHGIRRATLLEEVPCERSYRRFRLRVLPGPAEEALGAAAHELARLHSCVLSLGASMRESDAQLCEVLRSTSDPVQLADILSAAVIPNPQIQQQLLSTLDLSSRLSRLIDLLSEHMASKGTPPPGARSN